MVLRINRNRNTNDTVTISDAIALNSSTSIKIADANPNRIFIHVHNDNGSEKVWVKLQAASVDNDKKGIWLNSKGLMPQFWTMPVDNVYTGEICAIADSGSPSIYVTEY